MRYYLLALILLPLLATAQSKTDYEKAMARFVKFYNSSKGDSIVNMFNPQYRDGVRPLWKPEEMAKLHNQYGQIKSCKFKMIDRSNEGLANFETIFTKIGKNGSGMILKGGQIETFVLLTQDPDANKKQEKKKK